MEEVSITIKALHDVGLPSTFDQDLYRAFLKICDEAVSSDGSLPQPVKVPTKKLLRYAGKSVSAWYVREVKNWFVIMGGTHTSILIIVTDIQNQLNDQRHLPDHETAFALRYYPGPTPTAIYSSPETFYMTRPALLEVIRFSEEPGLEIVYTSVVMDSLIHRSDEFENTAKELVNEFDSAAESGNAILLRKAWAKYQMLPVKTAALVDSKNRAEASQGVSKLVKTFRPIVTTRNVGRNVIFRETPDPSSPDSYIDFAYPLENFVAPVKPTIPPFSAFRPAWVESYDSGVSVFYAFARTKDLKTDEYRVSGTCFSPDFTTRFLSNWFSVDRLDDFRGLPPLSYLRASFFTTEFGDYLGISGIDWQFDSPPLESVFEISRGAVLNADWDVEKESYFLSTYEVANEILIAANETFLAGSRSSGVIPFTPKRLNDVFNRTYEEQNQSLLGRFNRAKKDGSDEMLRDALREYKEIPVKSRQLLYAGDSEIRKISGAMNDLSGALDRTDIAAVVEFRDALNLAVRSVMTRSINTVLFNMNTLELENLRGRAARFLLEVFESTQPNPRSLNDFQAIIRFDAAVQKIRSSNDPSGRMRAYSEASRHLGDLSERKNFNYFSKKLEQEKAE